MDTNVFGAFLTRRNAPLVGLYASHLVGRVIVLAAQTVAELCYGDHWATAELPDDFDELVAAEEEAGRRDPYRILTSLTHTVVTKHGGQMGAAEPTRPVA